MLAWLAAATILILCLGWLLVYARLAWNLIHLHELGRSPGVDRDAAPRVSLVVAGRDEAHGLDQALRTLLAQDYPDLQVVFVDDRSVDGTGDIARRLATTDPRLVSLRVDHLPAGWLGKPHALARGLEAADGEWILFSDADVRFQPEALSRALGLAMRENVDHLTVLPDLLGGTFWLRVAVGTFGAHLLAGLRLGQLRNPRSRHSIGVGAFNLARRDLLARTPGFSWLRMEVAEDLGLGQMVKDAGGRTLVASGHGQVGLAWYADVPGMVRGLEKNTYGVLASYRPAAAVLVALAMTAFALAPVAAWWPGFPVGISVVGAVALLAPPLCVLLGRRRFGLDAAPAFFTPAGLLIMGWALLRSGFQCVRRGGIVWRQTFYPVAALRQGQRVSVWRPKQRAAVALSPSRRD